MTVKAVLMLRTLLSGPKKFILKKKRYGKMRANPQNSKPFLPQRSLLIVFVARAHCLLIFTLGFLQVLKIFSFQNDYAVSYGC